MTVGDINLIPKVHHKPSPLDMDICEVEAALHPADGTTLLIAENESVESGSTDSNLNEVRYVDSMKDTEITVLHPESSEDELDLEANSLEDIIAEAVKAGEDDHTHSGIPPTLAVGQHISAVEFGSVDCLADSTANHTNLAPVIPESRASTLRMSLARLLRPSKVGNQTAEHHDDNTIEEKEESSSHHSSHQSDKRHNNNFRDKVAGVLEDQRDEHEKEADAKLQWIRDMLAEEKKRQDEQKTCMKRLLFNPRTSRFLLYWHVLIVVVLIWDGFYVFFKASIGFFDMQGWGWHIWDAFCDFVYIGDVIVNFRTMHHVAEEAMEHQIDIARYYVHNWFLVDMLAAMPLGLRQISEGYNPYLRINRLFKFFHIIRIFNMWEGFIHNSTFSNMLKLGKLVFYLIVLFHWFGCLWWIIGRFEGFSVGSDPTDVSLRDSWGPTDALASEDLFLQLLQAWYWSFTTMTGLGAKINPSTHLQTSYTLIVMLIGVCVYAYIIGSFGSLIGSLDATQAAFRNKLNHVNVFLLYRQIPRHLRDRVIKFHELNWAYHQGFDDNAILKELPLALQTDIALAMNGEILMKVPLFKGAESGMLSMLALMLNNEICPPDECVFKIGDVGTTMYFIRRGQVAVVSAEGKVVATLVEGSFFGELSLLTSDKRTATIRAISYCDLFSMDKRNFDMVMAHFPRFHSRMKAVASKRQERAKIRAEITQRLKEQERQQNPSSSGSISVSYTSSEGDTDSEGNHRHHHHHHRKRMSDVVAGEQEMLDVEIADVENLLKQQKDDNNGLVVASNPEILFKKLSFNHGAQGVHAAHVHEDTPKQITQKHSHQHNEDEKHRASLEHKQSISKTLINLVHKQSTG